MATANRTLKLSILADVDDLKKKLGEADKAVEDNSNKISDFGKKAAAAFAVAAAAAVAYAGKLAVDGVKAAIEDEAAQLRLANALRSATGATDAQIKATEDMILKTSLATGVADSELRPALQRLAVSTKDTEQAQKLLTLALDISKGSGKDLETVANALGKAQDGNTTSLGRLGLGLSTTELKTLSYTQMQERLSDLYGGAASKNADTFQGRIDRLKRGFEETQEAVGLALLPVIERLIDFILRYGAPIVDKFKAAWDLIQAAINRNRDEFTEFFNLMANYVFPILQKVFGFMFDVGVKAAAAIIDAFGKIIGAITPVLNFIIEAINLVIGAINRLAGTSLEVIPKISNAVNQAQTQTGGFGGIPLGGAAGGGGGGFGGGGGGGGGGFGGGGGGIGTSPKIVGSVDKLNSQLDSLLTNFQELDFAIDTKQLTKKQATTEFNKLLDQFIGLEKVANAVIAASVPTLTSFNTPSSFTSQTGRDAPINIVVNAIDGEGAARAVAQTLNSQAARSITALRDK